MRARYAAAIRSGILKGRQTRYGDVDDPYYELRSNIIWGYSEVPLRELALRAFEYTWTMDVKKRKRRMTPEAREDAKANFKKAWEYWTESREERQKRLLREEVDALAKRVRALENNA